ncbi:relaxase/mobilization nuclease domain-containing protein [Yoonia sp. I 8.24]|nr:relaxase/mobilization nuclease domain-containing protein [Yoonia sp. I 8.24]
MILKGSQRSGAKSLADHLMNDRDNDHVQLLDLRGFMAADLHGALSEAHAISKATRCKQFMFSLSLNPPQDHIATEAELRNAADRAEQALGLNDQPRAIVVHEKEGRRHAHVVWSRIDADEMKAINLPHFKIKLRDLSRDLFLDHGWILPDGLATYGNKSPLNFTLAEWQQAKRQGIDPREIKQTFQHAWARCDSQIGFKNALAERGYFLAKGDRRGFVALDVDGNVYAIAKWTGIKAKDVRAKLGSPDVLPSVPQTQAEIRTKVSNQIRSYIANIKAGHKKQLTPLREERTHLIKVHRMARQHLNEDQAQRWRTETKIRSDRLNKGLRGLFDRITGAHRKIIKVNMHEAKQCALRDQTARSDLIQSQMQERQALQTRFTKTRKKHKQERSHLAQTIKRSLKRTTHVPDQSRDTPRRTTPGLSMDR